MFYSANLNSFFPASLRKRYVRAGAWPNDAVEIADAECRQYQQKPPEGMQLGADGNGRPAWVPIPPDNLDTLAAKKKREMDTARDAEFAEGLTRDIKGEPDVVQTRPQDQINLLGLHAKSQAARDQGVTDAVMKFRGAENVTRLLTPDEMYQLTNDALAHIEGIYDRSWERKDAITAVLNDEQLDDDAKRAALDAITW